MKFKKSSPVDSLNPFFFFFLLMNSSSSNLMGYCTLAIEFFLLKNHTSYYYINSFSLLWISFFLSHSLFVASQCSHIIEQANMKKKKKKKKRKEEEEEEASRSDPAWWWGEGRAKVGRRTW